MDINKVGVREFRANLPQYLMKSSSPLAITWHGETIGFYVPARHHHDKAEIIDTLKKAALNLEKLLLSSGITEEELFSDFRNLREKDAQKTKVLKEKKA